MEPPPEGRFLNIARRPDRPSTPQSADLGSIMGNGAIEQRTHELISVDAAALRSPMRRRAFPWEWVDGMDGCGITH